MQFDLETIKNIIGAISTADNVCGAVNRLHEMNRPKNQAILDLIKHLIKFGPKWSDADAPRELFNVGIDQRKYFYDCPEYAFAWPQVTKLLIDNSCITAAIAMLIDIPSLIPQFGTDVVTHILRRGAKTDIPFINMLTADQIAAIKFPDNIDPILTNIVANLVATGHLTTQQLAVITPFCHTWRIVLNGCENDQLKVRITELEKQLATAQTKLAELKNVLGDI